MNDFLFQNLVAPLKLATLDSTVSKDKKGSDTDGFDSKLLKR